PAPMTTWLVRPKEPSPKRRRAAPCACARRPTTAPALPGSRSKRLPPKLASATPASIAPAALQEQHQHVEVFRIERDRLTAAAVPIGRAIKQCGQRTAAVDGRDCMNFSI